MSIESIERNFIAVGTLDMLDKTVDLLECLIPDYLTGLTKLKRKFMERKHSKHPRHIKLNSEARRVMEKRLENEYKVFNYVKERLNRQYEVCQKKAF